MFVLIVAGTEEGIYMVEGSANEISEAEFVDALFMAMKKLKNKLHGKKKFRKKLV